MMAHRSAQAWLMMVVWAPESMKALTGWPLTRQLMYSITTWPKLSGWYSMAASMFESMFCCLISSAMRRCASGSKGSAFMMRMRCRSRSAFSFCCSLSTLVNVSRSPVSKASASWGLLCLRRASCSGLLRIMSRMKAGSSSPWVAAPPPRLSSVPELLEAWLGCGGTRC
uniref:Putative secreted protein n=1 Tax=Ixodes ricinus TaxID=34613 RepID=A0A6B0UXN9_IXORI